MSRSLMDARQIAALRHKVSGGVAPLGHGEREGPAGDKFSRSEDAGNGGRVRKERSDWSPPDTLCRSTTTFPLMPMVLLRVPLASVSGSFRD